jgi:transcriptional regulator
MYHLPDYIEHDKKLVVQFIKEHPFGMLIGCAEKYPVATQIPFLIEEREGQLFLNGHMMKGTDHYKAFTENASALCIFNGPHSYVSASWYSNPLSGSTWNYMAVHARGVVQFKSEEWLVQLLESTTAHFENDPHSPASFHHLPKSYIERMVKAIAGFEIKVSSLDAVFKLSQDREEESYHNIIQNLAEKDTMAKQVSEEMKKRQATLFPAAKEPK